MKPISISLVLLLSFSLYGQAQNRSDQGMFAQYFDPKPYAGMKIRLQGAVRARPLDSSAYASLWLRIDADKKIVSLVNQKDKPIRKDEWIVYTLPAVKVDAHATAMLIGGYTIGRGHFHFDDLHVQVQEKDGGSWEEKPLKNAGFEEDTTTLRKTWPHNDPTSTVEWRLDSSTAYEGRASFFADASRSYLYDHNDTAGKFAAVNGIRLYYEEYGDGAPLLLLHGNRGSIADFRKQIPLLSREFHVIAVDTRGQGRSSEDGKTYTYDLFAEDFNALLDHLHLDSVNLFGWSDGGNTGLIMAMRYPMRVRRLVTMGANIFIDKKVVQKVVWRALYMQKKELREERSPRAANSLRLVHMLETEPRHSFDDLSAIHCPVIVMAGEKDLIREEHTRQIAAHIAGSQLMIIAGATHNYPDEKPLEFVDILTQFFNK